MINTCGRVLIMKQEYSPKIYWENTFEFYSEKELLNYEYLCGSIKKRKQCKKVTHYYKSYSKWKESIVHRYEGKDKQLLYEFYRFLNYQKRTSILLNNMLFSFIFPVVVSIFASVVIPELIKLISSDTSLLTAFIIGIAITLAWVWTFIRITKSVAKEAISAEQQKSFYIDYMEIIKEIIER